MIDLPALSEDTISAKGLELVELWMVRLGEDIYGPFETESLKKYAQANPALMSDAEVTTMQDEHWVLFLQSPLKVTKKKAPPKLVSAQTLQQNTQFYLEKHGQRHGPFAKDQISAMVKNGELEATDLVSDDECLTWHKIYHFKEFENKPHEAAHLPFAPTEETINRSQSEALDRLLEEENPVKLGLVSLAYFGHRKSQAVLKLEELTLPKVSPEPTAARPSKTWWIAGGSVASALLVTLVWWAQAPRPLEIADAAEEGQVENIDAGSSLMNSNPSAPRSYRRPASTPRAKFDSPQSMTDTRRDLMDYRESHRDAQESQQPLEPMEADPYGADSQLVHSDDQGQPRRPAESPDDGYRMEEPVPGETGPIVEEVGDF